MPVNIALSIIFTMLDIKAEGEDGDSATILAKDYDVIDHGRGIKCLAREILYAGSNEQLLSFPCSAGESRLPSTLVQLICIF